jgi:hypothetical protein
MRKFWTFYGLTDDEGFEALNQMHEVGFGTRMEFGAGAALFQDGDGALRRQFHAVSEGHAARQADQKAGQILVARADRALDKGGFLRGDMEDLII